MIDAKRIKLLAFDADDTLWDCQSYFDVVEEKYIAILSDYGSPDDISASLFKIESANMPSLGYGCKAFILSLIENAIAISHGSLPTEKVGEIMTLGKELLNMPATPLPNVVATLKTLKKREGNYKTIVFTKGELLDQENKLKRSGLSESFDEIIVVSDKTQKEYLNLCKRFDCAIEDLVMVGNSFRSDIDPVLQLGGSAIYLPSQTLWQHEMAEEYEHERLVILKSFSELINIL